MYTITSRDNKIYKYFKLLLDKKQREREKAFLIEGERGVRDAIKGGLKPLAVVMCEGFECDVRSERNYVFARRLFNEITDTQAPQGIAAAFPMPKARPSDMAGGADSFVVMCENVRDPGNLGTIIRTAHCAGAEGLVLTKGCCDLFNPKVVRSTVAGIVAIPIIRDLETADALSELKRLGYKTVAGALTANCVGLYDTDLSGKIAFVVGNEANGITKPVIENADITVKIPMDGGGESLNVGVAAAVMMYEKVRVNAVVNVK